MEEHKVAFTIHNTSVPSSTSFTGGHYQLPNYDVWYPIVWIYDNYIQILYGLLNIRTGILD